MWAGSGFSMRFVRGNARGALTEDRMAGQKLPPRKQAPPFRRPSLRRHQVKRPPFLGAVESLVVEKLHLKNQYLKAFREF